MLAGMSMSTYYPSVLRLCSHGACPKSVGIVLGLNRWCGLRLQTRTQTLVHQPVTVLAGITVGNFAFWADSLLVAVLLYYGANSFKRVTEVKCDNQLPYIFQVRKPLLLLGV